MRSRRWIAFACGLAIACVSAGAAADEETLSRARGLADAGQYDEALSALDSAVASQPDDEKALALRADVLRRSGRIDRARRDYEALTRLRPSDTDPWFWVGTIERWQGKETESLRAYGRVLELAPCHGDAWKGHARVVRRQGDLTAAVADLRTALRCSAQDTEAAELLAQTLVQKGDRPAADKVLAESFTGADLEAHMGDLDLAAGERGKAAERYERAIAARPDDGALHRRLGNARREQDRTSEALAEYREAVRLDPEDGESLSWIGLLASRRGERDAAMDAFDRILAGNPADGAALTGKARLLWREGKDDEAIRLLDRALDADPDNADARVLRASVLSLHGRDDEARNDLRTVTDANPAHLDAWHVLDRVGARRSWNVGASYSESDVIEGLEDQGVQTPDGTIITPARVEYLSERVSAGLSVELNEKNELVGDLAFGREAVRNTGGTVYDYDIVEPIVGMDHRLSRSWLVGWRVGATRYSPREVGTVAEESHFKGSVDVERRSAWNRFHVSALGDSFVWRSFAAQSDFRIFTRKRLAAEWVHEIDRGFSFELGGGVSDFDDGNTVSNYTGAVAWSVGTRAATLRYRHDPFPARFLTTPDNRLDFIAYDSLSFTGRTPLIWGFRLSGEALAGRYGERPTIVNGVENGPPEHNAQRLLRAALAWSPARHEPFSLGAEYLSDHYDLDTSAYNNNNLHSWTLFAELADEPGPRIRYAMRYEHSFIGDERDPGYDGDGIWGRIETRPGSLSRRAGAIRLAFEAGYRENSLPEDFLRARFWLIVPF